jgi:hypothetical protein
MSWWATGITAAAGAYKGMKNEEKMDRNDKFRKAAIKYSPWTDMKDPGAPELSGTLDSGLQGGMQGYMMGQSFNKPETLSVDMGAGQGVSGTPTDMVPVQQQMQGPPMMGGQEQGQMTAGMNPFEDQFSGSAGSLGPKTKKGPWSGMMG